MQSSNPAFSKSAVERMVESTTKTTAMTVGGTVAKTFFLLFLVIASAAVNWYLVAAGNPIAIPLIWGGSLTAFVIALFVIFQSKPSPALIALYAIAEGLVLGGVSVLFAAAYQGIVLQAILLTLAITLGMLGLYATGIIKVTKKFVAIVVGATVGVLLFYLVTFALSLFGVHLDSILSFGPWAIAIAALIVFIAALNLVLDFAFIDQGARDGYDKSFEWYGAFGLMVTLIWLYISILRLLAVSRD